MNGAFGQKYYELTLNALRIVAGLLFGLVPALRASKTDLATAMKEKSRIGSRIWRFNLSSAMVVLQVGLSMVLLTGAGLFARSLLNLQSENVGFDRSNMLLVGIDPRLAGYKPAELTTLYQQILDRVGSLPNVRAVSLATYSPMSGTQRSSSIRVPGYTPQPGEDMVVEDILTGPKYAKLLGAPLLRGREIEIRDTAASPQVAVVNETFVNHFFKDQNPVGRTFTFEDETEGGARIEIVGVVADIKNNGAREKPLRTVYRPILQIQDGSAYMVNVHVRTNGDAGAFAGPVRQVLNDIDDKLPIFDVTTLEEQVHEKLKQDRLIAQLVSFFGALALILACIGLYGVMAQTSIVQLFVAGIVPGLIAGFGMMLLCYYYARRHGWPVEEIFNLCRVWVTFKEAFWALFLPVIILGGIFGGIVTATEGGGLAVAAALVIGLFIYRDLQWGELYRAIIDGATQTAVVMLLVAGSALVGVYLTEMRIPSQLAAAILNVTENKWAILALLNIFFLIIGIFLHSAAAIILVVPVVMPLVLAAGIDPVHFGVVVCLNLAIGQQTPPVASVLITTCAIAKADVWQVTLANLGFIGVLLVILLMSTYIPDIPMFLVELFYRR